VREVGDASVAPVRAEAAEPPWPMMPHRIRWDGD